MLSEVKGTNTVITLISGSQNSQIHKIENRMVVGETMRNTQFLLGMMKKSGDDCYYSTIMETPSNTQTAHIKRLKE